MLARLDKWEVSFAYLHFHNDSNVIDSGNVIIVAVWRNDINLQGRYFLKNIL